MVSIFYWIVGICKFVANLIYSSADWKFLSQWFREREPSRSFQIFFQNRLTEHNRNDSSKCLQINNGVTNQRQGLDNHIEEAYMIIIPHISKSVESGLKK